MSSRNGVVAATCPPNPNMYDTSCTYQTALDLKRMSTNGAVTGVSPPMTSPSVGQQSLSICIPSTFYLITWDRTIQFTHSQSV